MFRILVVDDNPADFYLFDRILSRLSSQCRVEWAKDGAEALDLLCRRKGKSNAAMPDLILMDINMPRVDGLQALSAIKSDPGLAVIPVIMLSTASLPAQVRKSYQAHANSFVQKPTNLNETEQLMRDIQAFWMDWAILPSGETGGSLGSQSNVLTGTNTGDGEPVAVPGWEARSQAVKREESNTASEFPRSECSSNAGCEEHRRLLDDMGEAVRELLHLHNEQFRAIVQGDSDCDRFDLLIHMANGRKQQAKYAYLRHVESHGCSNIHAIDKTRTRSD